MADFSWRRAGAAASRATGVRRSSSFAGSRSPACSGGRRRAFPGGEPMIAAGKLRVFRWPLKGPQLWPNPARTSSVPVRPVAVTRGIPIRPWKPNEAAVQFAATRRLISLQDWVPTRSANRRARRRPAHQRYAGSSEGLRVRAVAVIVRRTRPRVSCLRAAALRRPMPRHLRDRQRVLT